MRSFDFEIMRMISDQIALHLVQLLLYNNQINAHALVGQSAMGYCASKRASTWLLYKGNIGHKLLRFIGW